MDASALLLRQGWRGSGHSLDTSDRGIKRPLLISHKRDTLGLGKKKAAHNVDDQWWMRAFDESLRNIGSGQESTLAQVRKQGINRGGLYGFFVKGEGLAGTIFNSASEETTVTTMSTSSTSQSSAEASRESTPPTSVDGTGQTTSKKRKREDKAAEKEDRKRRKEEKRKSGKTSFSSSKSRERNRDSRAIETETVEIHVEEAQVALTSVERKIRRESKRRGKDIEGETQASGSLDVSEDPSSASASKSDKKKKRKKEAREEEEDTGLSPEDSRAVAAKVSKLTPDEKSQYVERARSKKQTLEQYVLRRIQKKHEKKKDASSAEVKVEKRRKGRKLVVKSERVRVVEVAA